MEYEWDEHKASTNMVKHGIDFADAATALEDEAAVTIADEFADEERFNHDWDGRARATACRCLRMAWR